eukprot:Blabericola_migrator_1__11832@NODE_719_length_6741_cov_45_534312_g518_i0_p4_GENE_NODE_719_length_6741_cov_45_534312_g518_i0NODE_719_length_6741_cov_45_534312_g518_i0_p4_ORF_typecomplete_len149_score16_33_NODE_719_length_6741_cov_45_534312_g518_i046695115
MTTHAKVVPGSKKQRFHSCLSSMGSKCFKDTVSYVRQVDDKSSPEKKSPSRARDTANMRPQESPDLFVNETPSFPPATTLRKRDRIKPVAQAFKTSVANQWSRIRKSDQKRRWGKSSPSQDSAVFTRAPVQPDVPWPSTAPPWPHKQV